MCETEIFRQSRLGWRLADLEPDLSAVRTLGNLPMQIPEECQLFVQVGDVGVVRDIRAFSKNNRRLETDTLQVIRLQATFGKCRQLLFRKPEFMLNRFCQKNVQSPIPIRQFQ